MREFYSPSFPIGGAERQALKLALELQRQGCQVTIVTGLWEWGQPRHEFIQGISVDRHFSAWGMFNIRGLRKFGYYAYLLSLFLYLLWHRNDYEIIHCQSALVESSVGVLAGQWLNKSTLVRPMASGAFGDFMRLHENRIIWGQHWLVSKLCQAKVVVALNPQIADEMVALGVARNKIVFIPNGVEIISHQLPRSYTLEGPLRIVFVGRLHPQKDIKTLLKSLGLLAHNKPNVLWELQLAGTGPLEAELKDLAVGLGIGNFVNFLGYVDHVDTLLEHCDCFVLPSLSEGMSNALLEAMGCGLPCIATDIAGNNSLIRHSYNGLLIQPKDELALAEAITTIATDEKLRQDLGQEAMKTVQDQYSMVVTAQKYASLYADLMSCKN